MHGRTSRLAFDSDSVAGGTLNPRHPTARVASIEIPRPPSRSDLWMGNWRQTGLIMFLYFCFENFRESTLESIITNVIYIIPAKYHWYPDIYYNYCCTE